MGNIQVTTRTQSIFPNGTQDSLVVKNNGPYVVYVDQDSAVNALSQAVPPTGTIAWDSNRPLWIVGDPNMPSGQFSSVAVTRNSQVTVFGNEVDNVLYQDGTATADDVTSGASNVMNQSPLLDCSAYQTLKVLLKNVGAIANGDEYAYSLQWSIAVRWYDQNLNDIGVDNFLVPYASPEQPLINGPSYPLALFSNINQRSRVSIPVRGAYCVVKIVWSSGATNYAPFLFTIIGMTRAEATRTCFTKYDAQPHFGANWPANGIEFASLTSDSWSTKGIPGASWPNIYIPGIKPNVVITMVSGFAITAAGLMRFRSPFDTTIPHWADVAIPNAAAGVPLNVQLSLPVDQPTRISFPTIPQQTSAPAGNLSALSFKLQYLD